MRSVLINLQGKSLTESEARELYGIRFETTAFVEAVLNDEGEAVSSSKPFTFSDSEVPPQEAFL